MADVEAISDSSAFQHGESHDHHGEDHNHDDLAVAAGPLPGMRFIPRELRPDFLDPLEAPRWLTVAEAAEMREDDFVLGLNLAEHRYALPWWIMKNHHVANLELEGRFFLITLCENCSSACAFVPVVEGRRLRFQVAGNYAGTFYIDDYETDSGWAPFTGEALHGELMGMRLEALPLYQCTWREWLELYPETLVLDGTGESREGHGEDAAPGTLERRMVRSIERDRRLKPNVLVLAVRVGELGRAYPLEALPVHGSCVNDVLGDVPLVVFGKEGSLLAIAFDRRVDGRELSFEGAGVLRFRDRETGSEWTLEGRAVSGPLEGRSLAFVRSAVEEWYAFAAACPGAGIFEMNLVRAMWGQGAK